MKTMEFQVPSDTNQWEDIMEVYVRIISAFRQISNSTISVTLEDGAKLADLIASLDQMEDLRGLRYPNTVILINKKSCSVETKLHQGDEIMLIQPLAGG